MLSISSAFDAGNIEVIALENSGDIQLRIVPDQNSHFFQWFYFRLQGAKQQQCRFRILNASEAAYVEGWEGYQALASYDNRQWFRVATCVENGELVIDHQPEYDSVFYAYFAPYSYERHLQLVGDAQQSRRCELSSMGKTIDQRELDLLKVFDPQIGDQGKLSVWITARQHPGETMAEWFVEGVLDRLLDEQNDLASTLLEKVVFYLVPNANPDGSVRGHLRTNAIGVNLNREWQQPSKEKSPEVFYLLEKMEKTGVDLYLDIHGDETIPYNFLAGCAGNPSFSDRQAKLEDQFKQCLLETSDEFQLQQGYTPDQFGEETLMLASNQVGHRFGCLSMTLEMPFKDNLLRPDPRFGWSPERSKLLAGDFLKVISKLTDELR